MSLDLTDDLKKKVANLEAEAAAIREHREQLGAQLLQLRKAIAIYRRTISAEDGIREQAGAAKVLRAHAETTTIDDVTTTNTEGVARALARSKSSKIPFVRALYTHPDPARRMTLQAWAEGHGVSPATVGSWVSKGSAKRRIPERWAQLIERELGIPATVKNWPNGIKPEG